MSRKARKKKARKATTRAHARAGHFAPAPREPMSALAGLDALLTTRIEAVGYEVVELRLHSNRHLRIAIDRATGITLTDCEFVSTTVNAALHDGGHDPGGFHVEVESPGTDRALTRPQDYERFHGERVTVALKETRPDGRRNFTGTLVAADPESVTIHVLDTEEPERFPRPAIREVRLRPEPPAAPVTGRPPPKRHKKRKGD